MHPFLHIISDPGKYSEKEELYLAVRKAEGRILTDEQVKQLPFVSPSPVFKKEWKIRSDSASWLKKYITKNFHSPSVLELGCGNGWLCGYLSGIPGSTISGIDLNKEELLQAAGLFGKKDIQFYYRDIFSDPLPANSFDIIVLAASVQYFPSLKSLFSALFPLLKKNGEIHIIDSHFYHPREVESAFKRSCDYYEKAGFPAMAKHYYHHSWESLSGYHFSLLNRSAGQRLFSLFHPKSYLYFPWIKICPTP